MAKQKAERTGAGRDRQSNSKAAEPAQAGRWAAPRMEAAAPAFAARTLARRVGDQQARRAMAAPPPARPSAPPATTGRAATPGPRAPSITPAATRAVHRCGCGGACPACRAKEEAAVHRKALPGAPSIGTAASPAVHRCGCGGTCAACRATEEAEVHRKALPGAHSITPAATRAVDRCGCGMREEPVHRQATDGGGSGGYADAVDTRPRGPGRGLDPATRAFMEPRFGRDFGGVRLHTGPEAARSARGLDARAFTVGQDIYFGQGEYSPGTQGGRRLLAHELTHTVQQSGATSSPQTALRVSRPGDALELEAERVAARVVDGTGGGSVSAAGRGVQRQETETSLLDDVGTVAGEAWEGVTETAGEAWDAATETAEEVGEAISEGADLVMGFARDLWDGANALATALGGVVSIHGTTLVIDVPAIPACPPLALQFSLPEIGEDMPLGLLIIPITEVVNAYGEVGVHAGLTPELGVQLGPCQLHGLHIVIDPLGPTVAAVGALTTTAAVSLGARVNVGLYGEVGINILWPDPPIVLFIPVARLEAGLEGMARGTAIGQVTVAGAMIGSLSGLALSADADVDLGLAADLGVAGYGALSVLGFNLCTLYWPLWEWHDQMTLSSSLSVDLAVGGGGAEVDLAITEPQIDAVPFESLPLDLQREMFSDECPLCDAFRALGLMPTQNGGGWTGHPAPAWPGPLPEVYPRDPGIPSGAECRGNCGSDCETCSPPTDRVVCEPTPDGRHRFWLYPGYRECGTHDGCRQHDAGYDWCAAGGEVTILGPCHRLPDFECVCNYGAPQCVGWIGGSPPHDGVMNFSDQPQPLTGCVGPCPEEGVSDQGATTYRLCLPDVNLIDRRQVFTDRWSDSTGDILLYETPLPLPYVPPALIEIYVRGDADAAVEAAVGPVWISGVCLDVDPRGGVYRGTGELHAAADVSGSLVLAGTLNALGGWGCLLNVLRVEAGLTGTGVAGLRGELTDRVEVSCRNGEIVLDNSVILEACLRLRLALDAHLRAEVFGFPVIEEAWRLAETEWGQCWGAVLGVDSLPAGGAAARFDASDLDATALLEFALHAARDERHLLDHLTGAAPGAAPGGGGAPGGGAVPLAMGASAAPAAGTGSAGTGSAGAPSPAAGGGGLTMPANPAAATGSASPCAVPGVPTSTGACPPVPPRGVILKLPPQKASLLWLYQSELGRLQHQIGRERDTDQTARWDAEMDPRRRAGGMSMGMFCKGVALDLTDRQILRPQWTPERRYPGWPDTQVDHRIEMQVSTIGNEDRFDDFWNYELLDQASNGSSGSRMKGNISRERDDLVAATGDAAWRTCDLTFTRVVAEPASPAGRWSFDQVTDGLHLFQYEDDTGEQADEDEIDRCRRRGGVR